MKSTLREELDHAGFALPHGRIDTDLLCQLDQTFTAVTKSAGQRDLLSEVPLTRQLLADRFLVDLVSHLFTDRAFVVRATLFDKRPEANWSVTWHQDQAIAVDSRHNMEGFDPWSTKNGVTHVEPPLEILQRITSIRLHLEDCTQDNGPLIVSPTTHQRGRVTQSSAIAEAIQSHGEVLCVQSAGRVLIMKPLTLHRSAKIGPGHRRRVIHLDCTDQPLPKPLRWALVAPFER